jgi:hypothetical protein
MGSRLVDTWQSWNHCQIKQSLFEVDEIAPRIFAVGLEHIPAGSREFRLNVEWQLVLEFYLHLSRMDRLA